MSDHLTRAYGDERFLSTLTLAFGALALVLAVVGVYGVVGWSSAQRSREFGLRTALGATPASLSALVLRQGMWPVAIGAAAGTASALIVARSIRGLLFDTAPARSGALRVRRRHGPGRGGDRVLDSRAAGREDRSCARAYG